MCPVIDGAMTSCVWPAAKLKMPALPTAIVARLRAGSIAYVWGVALSATAAIAIPQMRKGGPIVRNSNLPSQSECRLSSMRSLRECARLSPLSSEMRKPLSPLVPTPGRSPRSSRKRLSSGRILDSEGWPRGVAWYLAGYAAGSDPRNRAHSSVG